MLYFNPLQIFTCTQLVNGVSSKRFLNYLNPIIHLPRILDTQIMHGQCSIWIQSQIFQSSGVRPSKLKNREYGVQLVFPCLVVISVLINPLKQSADFVSSGQLYHQLSLFGGGPNPQNRCIVRSYFRDSH